jgi:phosphoadenosine phosphosulfate reductase
VEAVDIMQQDFFQDHVSRSIQLLQDLEPEDGYYLAFSGGKDSVVIYALAEMAGVKYDAHYSLTTVDPPELVQFIRKEYPTVEVHRPALSMWELIIKKRFPPSRRMRYCCEVLKEDAGQGRFLITGIRAAESARRAKRKQVELCHRGKGRRFIHPIFYWTDADVWAFIREHKIPYCKLYDDGKKRIGCIGCPMAGPDGIRQDFQRWPKYEAQYLRTFEKLQAMRKEEGKAPLGLEYTAESAMRMWLHGCRKKDESQGGLFDEDV